MNRKPDRGEIQDRLPDLLHGSLSPEERATVEAAIANDSDLARELDTLRRARTALTPAAPVIDANRIVEAIRRPPARKGFGGVARWRIAAAIATIAVGGASLAVVKDSLRPSAASDSLAVVGDSMNGGRRDSVANLFGYDMSGMSADEMDKLISQLEKTGGVPSTEPRSTVVVPPVEGIQ